MNKSRRLPRRRPPESDSVLYLYGFTRDRDRAAAPSVPGIDGSARVESLPCSGLRCWVSSVSRAEFADRLNEKMEDLEWLAGASVRHQRVVSEIARHAAVVPARFGTVFLGENSLAADVRRRRRQLESAFRRISGADEWGVKVFTVSEPVQPVAASSGREYLQKKSVLLRSRAQRAADPEVESFATDLSRVASDAAPAGKISSGQADLEWAGSFLVPRRRRKQWQSALDRWAAQWQGRRRIEVTGPWPPYSFVSAGR